MQEKKREVSVGSIYLLHIRNQKSNMECSDSKSPMSASQRCIITCDEVLHTWWSRLDEAQLRILAWSAPIVHISMALRANRGGLHVFVTLAALFCLALGIGRVIDRPWRAVAAHAEAYLGEDLRRAVAQHAGWLRAAWGCA